MKPIKTESIFKTPWCELVAKTMNAGEPPYYSLRLPDYTSIIAITPEERVLAVRQYRPALERYTIELPSGIIDPGETPESAARRELLEETGFAVGEIEPLGAMTPDNGRLDNQIWHFLARDVRRVDGASLEDGVEVITYSLPELAEAIVRGEFDHALHIGGLMLAVVRHKLRL